MITRLGNSLQNGDYEWKVNEIYRAMLINFATKQMK